VKPNLGKVLPPAINEAIEILMGLDETIYLALIVGLRDVSPSETPSRVTPLIASKLGDKASEAEVRKLISFGISSRNLISTFECTPAEIADVLTSTYCDNNKSKISSESIRSRILELINSRYVSLRTKISTLSISVDRSYDNARIVTDLRPVFPDDGTTDEIVGMVLMNTLRISFSGKDLPPIFISIAAEKLNELKGVVDRAIDKNESLKKFVENVEFENLTPGPNNEV
jgi:hypothetical protein